MSIQNLPLMRALGAKLQYLDKRQGLLAQNIANADTPDYRSKDLTKVDFGSVLKTVGDSKKVRLAATDAQHFSAMNDMARSKDIKDRLTYEVAPDKNAVIIEEQLVKANETQLDYNLVSNLLSKQGAMYRAALGRQG